MLDWVNALFCHLEMSHTWSWLCGKNDIFTAFVICHLSWCVNGGSWDHKTHSCDDDSLIWNVSSRRTNVWMSWAWPSYRLQLTGRLFVFPFVSLFTLIARQGIVFARMKLSDHHALFPDWKYKPFLAQCMTSARSLTGTYGDLSSIIDKYSFHKRLMNKETKWLCK